VSPERFDVYRRWLAELANEVNALDELALDELDEFITAIPDSGVEAATPLEHLARLTADFRLAVRRIAGVAP
jgi:hypothetical protein